MVRVGLIDDHQVFREGLIALLQRETDLEVVGQAGDARAGYAMVESAKPDVVILEVRLPGANGITAARELTRRDPRSRILMLSTHAEEEFVTQALGAGATGYALKEQPFSQIVEGIRAVAHGQAYLSPRISRFVVEDHLRLRRGSGSVAGPCDALSAREREVFDLLIRGFGNDAIAAQLCISVKTVETHRARVLKKLGMHSLVDLVRFAARHQLIAD